MPTKEYGRFPYEYAEKVIKYINNKKDIFKIITYNNLLWDEDYNYSNNYQKEYTKWLENKNSSKIYLIIQHDVDMFPERTLRMMELERELGIKTNVMIFNKYLNRKTLQETGKVIYEEYLTDETITRLQDFEKNGFSIGYHINAYEQALFNIEKAEEIFIEDVKELRKIFNIKTCSAHGGAKDSNGGCNFILKIPEILADNIRWVNNTHGITCNRIYTDSRLLREEETPIQFLESCTVGNRYQMVIHPQFYHTPWKDWRSE